MIECVIRPKTLVMVSLVAGCRFSGHGDVDPFSDAPIPDAAIDDAALDAPVDAAPDAPPDAPPLCATWMPRNITDLCNRPMPMPGELTINTAVTYDTDTRAFSGSGAPPNPTTFDQDQNGIVAVVMYIDGLKLTANGSLRVTGSHPLIILATGGISVAGRIDAGGHGAIAGAGADTAACNAHVSDPGDDDAAGGGSGGGGGGSFRGKGGRGGPGDNNPGPNAGGEGGVAIGTPARLRGGCHGATSGQAGSSASVSSSTRTPGGVGGGAIQLDAYLSIDITGVITVGGGGGGGAVLGSANGGGGGGSGGMIALEAPAITGTGRMAANGGGGGASGMFTQTGNAGTDGGDTGAAAPGGPSVDACGPAGAMGGAGATVDGSDASQATVACGGGGGGGGAGYIVSYGSSIPATIQVSPSVTAIP